jgi:hypothetical protein
MLNFASSLQHLAKQAEESAQDILDACIERFPGLSPALMLPSFSCKQSQNASNGADGSSTDTQASDAQRTGPRAAGVSPGIDSTGDDGEEMDVELPTLLGIKDEVISRDHESALLDAASAMHVLAFCFTNANR